MDTDDNPDTIFTIKDTKLYVCAITLSAKDNQKLSKLLSKKYLKDQCIWMNIKQNVRIKIWQNTIDIFSNQTLQELTDCLFWFIQSTRQCLAVIKRYEEKHKNRYKAQKYYLPKGVNKNYNVIINTKNLYD